MVIQVYISAISASKEVKKRQQRAQFILDSLKIDYENVDITEPEHESERQKMKDVCKKIGNNPPLPPQFFNGNAYCGDWFDFETASENDRVPVFLKLETDESEINNSTPQLIENFESNDSKPDNNDDEEQLNDEKFNREGNE